MSEVSRLEPTTASDVELAAWAARVQRVWAPLFPHLPPDPVEWIAAMVRHQPAHRPHAYIRVGPPEGPLRAAARAWWTAGADNQHRVDATLDVMPDETDGDLPMLLLGEIVRVASEHGHSVLGLEVAEGSGDWTVAERLGARLCLREVRGELDVSRVVRSDVAALTSPPDGYGVVCWDGPCPEELLDDYVALTEAMNTAPIGELDLQPVVASRARVREWERAVRARGHTAWVVAARHERTGRLAGYTQLNVAPERPWIVEQQNTAVLPAHRGHGLGLVVKAVNLLRLLDERPEARFIETWNATDNAHMLAVNNRLGFRPGRVWGEFEIRVDDLAGALAAGALG